jgi:xylan 1,4-beta-xylosidase
MGGSLCVRRWLRLVLWALLATCGVGFVAGIVGYLWLTYVPAPSLPQSRLLSPVTEVRVTTGQGIISIDWTPLPEAVCYQVLRSGSPSGPFALASSHYGVLPLAVKHTFERIFPGEPFGRIPHGPWVDSDIIPGHTYYYRVRGNDGSAWSPQGITVSATAVAISSQQPNLHLRVDASHITGRLEHKWETALGSEHLSYMFKGDLNPHVKAAGEGLRLGNKLAHDQLGIQYIRAHGILMDDPSVYTEDAGGNPHYDWSKVDKLYDILRQDGLRPYVELSFMPAALAADPRAPKIFKYQASSSPPKDYRKWQALIAAFARHLIERYGKAEVETWPFEVWNEPDVKRGIVVFWSGSQEEYFRLYDYAAAGLKSVDPNLRIGGPVVAFSTFQEPFLRHVTTENFATGGHSVPLDFLDMHNYSLPAPDYRPLLRRYGLADLPIYFTEWGISLQYGDQVSDLAYSAAATISGMIDSLDQVSAISYWTASDYFEESGDPRAIFHGGFGLIGLDGLRKPRFWAYSLLHQLGADRLAITGNGDGFDTLVKGLATRNPDGSLCILLSNSTPQHAKADGSAALSRHISLVIAGLAPGASYRLEHDRIDNSHSNVYGAWEAMGKPRWPDASQMSTLHHSDELQTLTPPSVVTANAQGETALDFDLPMPAVSFLKLTPEANQAATSH